MGYCKAFWYYLSENKYKKSHNSCHYTNNITFEYIDWYIGADLWKTEDGIFWEPVTLNGFDNPNNYGFRTMVEGSLYVGTANPFQGCEVWQTPPELIIPPPVGGEAYPMSKVSISAPWIVVGMLSAASISWYILRRRRTQG